MFVSPDGARLATRLAPADLGARVRAGRLAGLRFHDLRSLAATALVAVGTDVKTAQTRLGHSSSGTILDIYARATTAADQTPAEKVGTFLRPPGPFSVSSPGTRTPQ